MSKIFKSLKPKADLAHHPFDLSRRDIYSSKVGILTPCFVQDTIPDATYDVQQVNIIRTDSIQSAPFARLSSNIDYHFVPYSQLWHGFEQFYYERGDSQRNYDHTPQVKNNPSWVPQFKLSNVVNELFAQYRGLRLAELLLAKVEDVLSQQESDVIWLRNIRTALQRILYYNSTANNISSPNLAFYQAKDVHSRWCVEDCLKTLDMLGYGNFLPQFKYMCTVLFDPDALGVTRSIRLYNSEHNITAGADFSTFTKSTGTFGDFLGELLNRFRNYVEASGGNNNDWSPLSLNNVANFRSLFLTLCSIHPITLTTLYDEDPFNTENAQYVNAFRLAAYFKVWSDYYRNSQYDVDLDYSYFYNFDWTSSDNHIIPSLDVIYMLQPLYRQWKKDLFTGGYPTAQFGSVAVASLENPAEIISTSNSSRFTQNPIVTDDYKLSVEEPDSSGSFSYNSEWNINSSVSALSIRQAMAMQRYKERILRAGTRIKSLQTALFGDTSKYILDTYAEFLNGVGSGVDFNNIATTAEGNDRNVGELASNGVSTYGGKAFRYHSHDFGVLIGVHYIIPEAEYEAFGLDVQVTKSEPFDYFKADFQNLGLSPVFSYEFNNIHHMLQRVGVLQYGVYGYLARYHEYKTSFDKVHGEFYSSVPSTLGLQIPSNASLILQYTAKAAEVGAFANFVTPRKIQTGLTSLTLSSLYVNPNAVDSIFYITGDLHQASDQFKVNMNHKVTAVLPMSVIGLPQ